MLSNTGYLTGRLTGASGYFSSTRLMAGVGLILLWCIVGLTACGGGEGSEAVVASAEDVEIGKELQGGDWKVALTKPPEQVKIVGEGDITYQAEGTYIIVFIKVTNSGQALQVVPRELLKVTDGQNQEFSATQSAVQVAYILPRKMELLLDSPLPAGESRESIIIYDVPSDAGGLKLTMTGVDETIDLGF
jgi:hypothetical protein